MGSSSGCASSASATPATRSSKSLQYRTARASTIASLSGKKRYTDPIDTPATSRHTRGREGLGALGGEHLVRRVEHAAQSLAAARLDRRVAKAIGGGGASHGSNLKVRFPSRNHLNRVRDARAGARARRRGRAQLGRGRTRDRDRRQRVRARRRAGRGHADRRTARGRSTPEQIAVVDLDGEQVDGDLAPTSELGLHLGIYRRYDGGRSRPHATRAFATALSCVLDELPVVHYQMLALGGPIARRALRHVRHPGAGRADPRSARGPERRADGQPRRDRLRTRPRQPRWTRRCCSSGRASCTGGRRRSARRARSIAPSSSRSSRRSAARGYGITRRSAAREGRHARRARRRRAGAPGGGDPRGTGRRRWSSRSGSRRPARPAGPRSRWPSSAPACGAPARSAATRSATSWWSCWAASASTRRCSCVARTCRPRPACCRSGPTARGRPST